LEGISLNSAHAKNRFLDGVMMRSPSYFFAVCAFFLLVCPRTFGGITYHVESRAGSSDSWSLLGGSITTDGTIGEIDLQNIVSWRLRFSSPSGESEISSLEGEALQIVESFLNPFNPSAKPDPSLIATMDHLTLNPAGGGILALFFADDDLFSADFSGKAVGFSSSLDSINGRLIDNTVDIANPYRPFYANPNVIPAPSINMNHATLMRYRPGSAIIGSVIYVPEPPSCGLHLVMTFACLSLLGWQRQSAGDSLASK